ncbi:hypothetical protein GHT06_018990 [Daphnia sinensis]|uniref:Integrase catalytic domain-containing protein n=1 Tax=Daphnia sinensis TaxID=1820382 RepID=A0AAD5PN29_9CRUS|nr:hypothetical protein GHT06_018990 [Daphnia sinensis]
MQTGLKPLFILPHVYSTVHSYTHSVFNLNNTLEEEVGKLISRIQEQESDIQNLEDRVKNYKKLQVQFIETDDNNDSRPIGDESEDISNFVGGIIDSTLPTDKSLHYELEVEQTGDFDQTVEDLRNQIELLNKTVGYLQQENQKLSNKINMGVTHDEDSTTSAPQQWGGSTTPQAIPPTASTSQGPPSQFLNTNSKAHVTDPDEEEAIKKMSKFVTNPIVKAIGDLFSREDKKEIPTYKGKSTDKLITEWLKGAEHVARNNDWNDDQKIRLFSDRLKGEAFEWHENYAEEEGDNLNYPDWKEAIITRFQDKVDLATLENKFSKLKQKPEENCRAFVSRLNSLHDTIEGKEEKSDHNQTIAEGQLLNKLRKVRDKRKKKVLLQGLLPKYRKELFLRMPDDPEDFDALCKQLFLSEKILHTKEETEDDDMSAVIAGITKHQDEKFQLLEQKLTESLTEIKLSNTKCGSSQDKLTIAAVDLNDRRRSNSRDSRVRFASSREPSRERSASRNRDNSPYRRNYNTSEQRHQNSSERQDYRPPERQDYTPAGYIQPSRFVFTYPMRNQTAQTIAKILVNKIFTKYGSPEVVLTDQGTNFLSSLIEEVCKLFKIRRIRTTAYHPQTDGLVERFNRTLCDMLACYVADEPEKWDKYLPFVTFAYNTAKQASIRETPFYLFFGREPIMPNDIKINRRYETYEDTSMMYSHQWEKAQKLAKEHLFKAATRQKKYYDNNTKMVKYNVGDYVLLKAPPTAGKFILRWNGPFQVTRSYSDVNYEIQHVENKKLKSIVHANRLKLYTPRKEESTKKETTNNPTTVPEKIEQTAAHQFQKRRPGRPKKQDSNIKISTHGTPLEETTNNLLHTTQDRKFASQQLGTQSFHDDRTTTYNLRSRNFRLRY